MFSVVGLSSGFPTQKHTGSFSGLGKMERYFGEGAGGGGSERNLALCLSNYGSITLHLCYSHSGATWLPHIRDFFTKGTIFYHN